MERFDRDSIDEHFLRSIANLSKIDDGPRTVVNALAAAGIGLVYVEQLPEMYLDSAVMLTNEDSPVIGLTLRNDSLNSFWFSVLHSVAHIWKHLSKAHYFFADDFDIKKCNCNVDWSTENEADQIALETLAANRAEHIYSLNTFDYSPAVAETIKLPANSISMKVAEENPTLKPISKRLQTNSIREYFL